MGVLKTLSVILDRPPYWNDVNNNLTLHFRPNVNLCNAIHLIRLRISAVKFSSKFQQELQFTRAKEGLAYSVASRRPRRLGREHAPVDHKESIRLH